MNATCKVCGHNAWTEAYRGPIRLGKATEISTESYVVHSCDGCGSLWLPPIIADQAEYYASGEYRADIGESNSMSELERRHDPEVKFFLERFPLERFRGAVVADFGCGAGSFLDAVRGVARETIAVELNKQLHDALRTKGHACYSSAEELLADRGAIVDIVTSHSVIEHVPDPHAFLAQIKSVLQPGGQAIVSTPNLNSFLMQFGPAEYKSFFFRKVHEWYFSAAALGRALETVGFKNIAYDYQHSYRLSNAFLWMRDRKAPGDVDMLGGETLDLVWKQFLLERGLGERLIAKASL